jgi:phytoene desaturase
MTTTIAPSLAANGMARRLRGRGRAVVIGSGFGGIAAAIRLRAKGYDTTILEMRDKPGGRAYVYEDEGFVFDAGPTIITVPFILHELADLAGRSLDDYVKIVPCDPYYRIYLNDGRTFDYVGDDVRLEAEIAKFSKDDVAGYREFLAYSRRVFDRAFTDLADHSFHSIWEMAKVAPDLMRLRAEQSVFKRVSKFIKDPALRQIFSFEPLLIGGNPLRSSSIYSMIHYLEKTWGVHFAMGGTGALVRGLVRMFEEMGGKVELNQRVEEIQVEAGAVKAVRTAGGGLFPADVVVSNADVANTYRKLIGPEHRRKWTDRRLEKMRYAMSLFVVYFGTPRRGRTRAWRPRGARGFTSSAPCRISAAVRIGTRSGNNTPTRSWRRSSGTISSPIFVNIW